MRILVTAFGAFGEFQENPSVDVAKSMGLPFKVLEVSFKAVDEFISGHDFSPYDSWIQIGVSGQIDVPHLELVGRNVIGETPDVRGEVHGPGLIDPSGPPQRGGTLWRSVVHELQALEQSVDAGSYLCNYLYYTSLQRVLHLRIGFVHIPPADKLAVEETARRIQAVLAAIAAEA